MRLLSRNEKREVEKIVFHWSQWSSSLSFSGIPSPSILTKNEIIPFQPSVRNTVTSPLILSIPFLLESYSNSIESR